MAEKPFQPTAEEVDQISKALKNDEFRKLFFEYAQEISDPENKQLYESELIALEKQRGVDVKFLKPTPGFVLKTYILPEGKQKLFVNICENDTLQPASAERVKNSKGKTGQRWSIPYSLTPPREDYDKAKNKCKVVDALFHPDTYKRAQQDAHFKQLLIDSALDGVEQNYRIKTDRKRITYPKITYKGMAPQTVIRTPKDEIEDRPQNVDLGDLPLKVPYPPLKNSSGKPKPASVKEAKKPPEPHYTVVYSGEFTMQDFTNERESSRIKRPKKLVITIELPGVESAGAVDLEIYEKRLTLECSNPVYKLDLALSYPVNDSKGTAKFDKAKKTLTVTLPVLPPPVPQPPLITPRQLVSEIEPVSNGGVADQSMAENCKVTNQNRDEESCDDGEVTNQNGDKEPCIMSTELANQNEDEGSGDVVVSRPATEEWASVGEWSCPSFSYRQDESSVTFVLHTPGVKEKSLVSNFDHHFAHLTYRTTTGKSYSFYVSFGEECSIESDDCVVDISDENMAVLLTKDTKEVWEKFRVGLNAVQTTEKLFLTESNVQSTIEEMESFPDPWASNNGRSGSAQVRVVSQNDSQLDVEIVDQPAAKTENLETSNGKSAPSETEDDSNVKESSDPKPTSQDKPDTRDSHPEPTVSDELDQASSPNIATKSSQCEASADTDPSTAGADSKAGGSFVKVEDDGSVFVQADTDYIQKKCEGKIDFSGEKKNEGRIQFSNKLMFSLD